MAFFTTETGERDMTFRGMICAAGMGVLLFGVGGCNSARMVRWDGSTGVVAVPSNDNSWPSYNLDHAEELMKKKCPQGYSIIAEEEVVTGKIEHTNTNTERTGDPLLAALHIVPVEEKTRQTTSYQDQKEWRITFRAGGAAPPRSRFLSCDKIPYPREVSESWNSRAARHVREMNTSASPARLRWKVLA